MTVLELLHLLSFIEYIFTDRSIIKDLLLYNRSSLTQIVAPIYYTAFVFPLTVHI